MGSMYIYLNPVGKLEILRLITITSFLQTLALIYSRLFDEFSAKNIIVIDLFWFIFSNKFNIFNFVLESSAEVISSQTSTSGSVVNALSKNLHLSIRRDGKVFEQHYSDGIPKAKLKATGKSETTGTEIKLTPSRETFTNVVFDFDILAAKLRDLSFLNAGLKIILEDQRVDKKKKFEHKGGLSEFVEYLNGKRNTINSIFHFSKENKEGISVEVALQWNDGYQENVNC